MAKKQFAECEMEILQFGRQDIIETSAIVGDQDDFNDGMEDNPNDE